ncbi:MAG: cytochrome c3 family protein [Desulfarculaceae bacterium]|nr:cytochrome c3 family protein [Desulfarculaceae bacterium]MCF8047072.1 cytochrome c3 family protein [Desulfarculaceae bacterium]MCF8098704.1 cytochrome c3 family protein [Desulfarculaceae bacterium]MCF8123934.1 cytochrome c3 family protein [Desulfarculaceae bacterium]
MKRLLLILLPVLAMTGAALAQGPPQLDSGCIFCHPKFQAPMPPAGQGHALACTICHLGDGQAKEGGAAHKGMVKNPSALGQAQRACGACHKGWPDKVKRSPMATNMGVIAHTRYLWGAQSSMSPQFAVREADPLPSMPDPEVSGKPVDDFLRRRCLRCHLWSRGADTKGARRAAGCAACHRPYDAQGKPPQGHGLTKKVPVSQCLRCHSGCGAGAEYAGRTPRDAVLSARFLATQRDKPEFIQDRVWRPMRPDVHFKAGLGCLDCHPRSEVMGDGRIRQAGLDHVGLRCSSCHGELGKKPPQNPATTHGAPLTNLEWRGGKLILTGKLDGMGRQVPLIAGTPKAPVAHRIAEHSKVACHACHASYNPGAWGMQVLLETRPNYGLHGPIAAQGDPQVFKLLSNDLRAASQIKSPPQTRDYLSGQMRRGMWIISPWFRRHEWRVYGLGPNERTYLLNPRFQYALTLMDPDGKLTMRAQVPSPGLGVTPWNPHTTAKATVGCTDCHGSAKALGLGLTFAREAKKGQAQPRLAPELWLPGAEGIAMHGGWTKVVDAQGRALQAFLLDDSRPYNRDELRRLLEPGKNYKQWLLKALQEGWAFKNPGPTK